MTWEAYSNNFFLAVQGVTFGHIMFTAGYKSKFRRTDLGLMFLFAGGFLAILGVPTLAAVGIGDSDNEKMIRLVFNGWLAVVGILYYWMPFETKEKRKVSAIVAEADVLSCAFEQLPIGAIILNRDGHIVQVNSALCRDFGYNPSELIGLHVNILLPAEKHDGHIEKIRSVIDGAVGPSGWREVAGKHKKGQPVPINLSVQALDMGLLGTGQSYGIGLTELRS